VILGHNLQEVQAFVNAGKTADPADLHRSSSEPTERAKDRL
jgi:hypothetical protein